MTQPGELSLRAPDDARRAVYHRRSKGKPPARPQSTSFTQSLGGGGISGLTAIPVEGDYWRDSLMIRRRGQRDPVLDWLFDAAKRPNDIP
jgi:hypothetical protein